MREKGGAKKKESKKRKREGDRGVEERGY